LIAKVLLWGHDWTGDMLERLILDGWSLFALALLCAAVVASPSRPLLVQDAGNTLFDESQVRAYLPDLYEAGISDLQSFLSNGSFTSVQLTKVRSCHLMYGLSTH
jgi:hypothetical protein